jgi:hypothetical protein
VSVTIHSSYRRPFLRVGRSESVLPKRRASEVVHTVRGTMRRVVLSVAAVIVTCIGLFALPEASVATTTAPMTWSQTGPLDSTPPLGPDTHLQSVSCPQAGLCVAVDAGGNVLTSTSPTGGAGTWRRSLIDPGAWLAAISCPTESLCVAGDSDGNLVVSTDPTGGATTWSKVSVTPGVVIDAVSCPIASFCVAGTQAGQVIPSTNPTGGSGAWTAKGVVGPYAMVSVSCVTATFCAAVDAVGQILTSTTPSLGGLAWHPISPAGSGNIMLSVTCATTSFCAAGDNEGNVFTSTDPTGGVGAWTRGTGSEPSRAPPFHSAPRAIPWVTRSPQSIPLEGHRHGWQRLSTQRAPTTGRAGSPARRAASAPWSTRRATS